MNVIFIKTFLFLLKLIFRSPLNSIHCHIVNYIVCHFLLLCFYLHNFILSFPGGKFDETDASLTHTALRECEEELGINQNNIEVWAELGAVPDRVGLFSLLFFI